VDAGTLHRTPVGLLLLAVCRTEEGSMPMWWSNALRLGSCLQLVSLSVPMPVAPSRDFHHLMWSMVVALYHLSIPSGFFV
jgi:hypothetical protein